MIVDTSVWIDHFRRGNQRLHGFLEQQIVLIHPFVVGELACGNLRDRPRIIALLDGLPSSEVAEHDEALGLLSRERLYGRGVGWMDVHLLASAMLSGVRVWTLDRRLAAIADELEVGVGTGR